MKSMSREILFRGLHRRKGEKVRLDGEPVESKWVYGGFCQYNEERGIIYQTEPEIAKFPVYAETVGQYTGLNDMIGVKIFEGDIVKCFSREDVANCVVIFECGEFHLVPVERYKEYQECFGYHAIRCFDKIVIGNVHDNPELLEPDEKHDMHGIHGEQYGIWNTVRKCWQFDICEDTPMLAEARLVQKIGDDARTMTPETLGRYTGLTDKNGVKIFEGDIIEYFAEYSSIYSRMEKGTVHWDNTIGAFCVRNRFGSDYILSVMSELGELKVTGSIHENPKSLKRNSK